MRITTALVADAAAVENGKLFVLGGAFDTIWTAALPAVHGQLALALVAEVEPGERQRDLDLTVRLVDEDEERTLVEALGTMRVGAPATLRPGDFSTVPLVMGLNNLEFPAAKGYAFVVSHGGDEIARVRFQVRLREG